MCYSKPDPTETVMPAKAGIQELTQTEPSLLDASFRWHDSFGETEFKL
jgi:hypothetical protein